MANVKNRIANIFRMAVYFVPDPEASLCATVSIPVNCLTGVICPYFVEPLITITIALTVHFRDHIELVRIVSVLQLFTTADRCKSVTNAGTASS